MPTAETSFDPQYASDASSDTVIANVFESMLDYDYLARPVRLVPRTLEAMPVTEDGGKTYLCRVRKGIFFTPDPAFKGKPRELTAQDHAYALKRLLDPAVRSPWAWLVEGKLVGGDELQARAAKTGKLDYDASFAGLEVVDRYTLRIRLKAPDLRFPYVLAVPNTAAIAREVVDAYGIDIGAHPVGTGPVHAGRVQAQLPDRARRQSGFPRRHLRAGGAGSGIVAGRSRPTSRARNCRARRASTSASSRKRRRAGSRS